MNRAIVLVALASFLALVSFIAPAPAAAQTVAADPAPGTYHHDIVLSLTPPATGQELYYRISIDGTQQTRSPTVRYSVPLFLSALPGKRRTYRITIETREGKQTIQTDQSVWSIDRSVPLPPATPAPTPSTSTSPPASAANAPTSIPILSPVSGTFGNEQLLYIDRRELSWVRYTLDGSDPTRGGVLYSHPVVIPKSGSVDLKVAALARGSNRPITAEVSYTVEKGVPAPLSAKSGITARPLTLEPPGAGSYYYTLQDQTPDSADIPFDRPIEIGAPPGSFADTVLRLRGRTSDGSWGPDFRYFFAVDRRPAPRPTIELSGGTVASLRTRIRIDDAPYVTIYFTTDGSTPTPATSSYSAPFTPDLPPESAGTITVRAVAFAPNGSESRIATAEFPYLTKTPQPPTFTLERQTESGPGAGRLLRLEVPNGSVAVYERTLDGSVPPAPTARSPRATSQMLLSAPRGTNVLFSLRFATVDATGAVSAPTKPVVVRLDELPPAEPSLSFADGTLTITGGGSLRYTLTDNGAPPADPGPNAKRYDAPVPLAGSAGARVEYYAAAAATSISGLQSAIVRGGPYVVDRRAPALPVYWGVTPGGIYNDTRTLSVEKLPGEAVHFTLSTDGRSPGDPTADSPVFGSDLQFSVPEGGRKSYVVKLREEVGGQLGPVATVPFTIDRVKPSVPPLDGVGSSEIVNHPLVIDPPKAPPGESVYLSMSTQGSPGDPLGTAGRPFDTPVFLSAGAGQELTYHLRLAARDRAGNAAEGPTLYTVTIDRRLPDSPVIQANPSGGTVAGEVSVTIGPAGGRGSQVYHYELTDDGSDPPAPTTQSPKYSSPIVLKPRDGQDTLYTLFATAEDAAGNLSTAPSIYRVLVRPAGAPAPQNAGAGASSAAPVAGAPGTSPGSPGTTETTAAASLPKELLEGAKNGGLYGHAVTLTTAVPQGVVRYEIDSGGGTPPPVTRFSPELPKALALDPLLGETRHYEIRAALFESASASAPETSQRISFAIDRTPPPPPHISGIRDNARYQQQETFSLHAARGRIYFSLDKLTPFVSSGSHSSTKYREYTNPVTIGAGETSARYRIHAYTLNAVGNRSLETAEWTVYFDRGVVYVSPSGSDRNTGTSVEPVKTLGRALELAQADRRGTIFLASGSYALDREERITSGISILGDFDPKDWHQTTTTGKQRTSVRITGARASSLFSIDGGGLSIENLVLRDVRGGPIIRLRTGALSASNSTLESNDGAMAIVAATGGTISLDHVSFDNRGGGPDISATGAAQLSANGSTFAAGDTDGDSVLLELSKGAAGSLSDSFFRPASGLRTYAIRAVGARVKLEGSTIESGIATRQSVAIFASASTVELADTTIVANADSHLTFGIQTQDSTVTIEGSTIGVEGSVGATGVWADASHVEILRSRLRAAATAEFLYLVKLSDSTALVSGSILEGAATGDYVGVGLTRTPAKLVGNTIVGGDGADRSAAIVLEDSPGTIIVDNILARAPGAVGRAISISSGSTIPTIVANDVDGYPVLLGGPDVPDLTSISALNRMAAAGRGGAAPGNLAEPVSDTFVGNGDLHLNKGSACIAAGVSPAPYGGLTNDFDGVVRRAPFDIGAVRHR